MGVLEREKEERERKEAEEAEDGGEKWVLIFTYGTLKKGFHNHRLMEDLMRSGDSAFVGTCTTTESYPLVCGPYRVPFLLNMRGSGHPVFGELYSVSPRGLSRLDELEGLSRGHYERRPIAVSLMDGNSNRDGILAQAYYAHPSYAAELWDKNRNCGYTIYSELEATGYVKRSDRPSNLTFLDQIRLFISSS